MMLEVCVGDTVRTWQWRIQDFEKGDSVPIPRWHAEGSTQRCVALICLREAWKKNSPLFRMGSCGTFMLCTAIYVVHDIIVLNFDDNGSLRTTKSIQKVMKSDYPV